MSNSEHITAQQFKALFLELKALSKVCDLETIGKFIETSSDLTELDRHILLKLLHGQSSAVPPSADELTGLLTRSSFLDKLAQALLSQDNNSGFLALCFLDLDEFKMVNDCHGHLVGDHVISEVASRLLNSTRSNDLVCRWGGDEFVIVLPSFESRESIHKIVNRILDVIRTPIKVNSQESSNLRLGASIGVVIASNENLDGMSLVAQADRAMYFAKRAGKNCIHFHSDGN